MLFNMYTFEKRKNTELKRTWIIRKDQMISCRVSHQFFAQYQIHEPLLKSIVSISKMFKILCSIVVEEIKIFIFLKVTIFLLL